MKHAKQHRPLTAVGVVCLCFFMAVCLAVGLGGCKVKGTKQLAVLAAEGQCSHIPAQTLLEAYTTINHTTKSDVLQCLLTAVRRGSSDAQRPLLGAKTAYLLADREADKKTAHQLASEGLRFAEAALAVDGNTDDGNAHYYLALTLGLVVRDDRLKAFASVKRLERHLKRALELSPQVDESGPRRVLGLLYIEAPPWPTSIGDADQSLELLDAATKHHPNHPLNQLFYAYALLTAEEEDGLESAIQHFAEAQRLFGLPHWQAVAPRWQDKLTATKKQIADFQN